MGLADGAAPSSEREAAFADGRVITAPGAPGLVVGAPHGTSDDQTDWMSRELTRRSGFGLVLALGFGNLDSSGRRFSVNRPTEGVPGCPPRSELQTERARRLYDRLGFELESFGDNTIRVGAVPALLKIEDSSKALLGLAEDLEGLDRGAHVQEALQRIAATTACHAAVKANYPLTPEKMAHILEELRHTAYSTICPHGRPVMLRLTRREVEKNFQRI